MAQANLPNVNFTVVIPAGQGSHTHTVSGGIEGGTGAGVYSGGSSNTLPAPASAIVINAATLPAMSGTAASGGSGSALTTLPPLQIVTKIIKL